MKDWLKKFFWLCVMAGVVVALVIAIFLLYLETGLPDVNTLKNVQLQEPLRIYTQDGKLIGEYGVERRSPVSLDQVPKSLIQATVATEDQRYFDHSGIDVLGLLRAAVVVATTGHKAQGGSTITMQVARNYFLSRKKTYLRKIREILLAMKIDHELSKDKVLKLYFNKIFYGNRAYGVSSAAHTYYGKSLSALTLPQLAMLAGLPKAPSTLNPLYNPDAALDRRDHVLTRMHDLGFISDADYQSAMQAPLTAKYHGPLVEVNAPYVAAMVQKAMRDKYGESAFAKGLNVVTTIDSVEQAAANHAVFIGLLHYDRRHGYRGPIKNLGNTVPDDLTQWQDQLQKIRSVNGLKPAVVIGLADQTATVMLKKGQVVKVPWSGLSWARKQYIQNGQEYMDKAPQNASDILSVGDVVYVYQAHHWWLAEVPIAQSALVAVNPETGSIKAMVGGFSYTLSQFNRATQARRQPGSSFKPFIYSAALEKGYTLASMINDAPVVQAGDDALWRPQNDTDKFYGMTSLKDALMQSRNLVSVRLLQLIGIPYAIDYVTRFGFSREQLPNSLSLALGTASVTPLQMAGAYAVFASGGYRTEPHLIQSVSMPDGDAIYTADLPHAMDAKNTDLSNIAPQVITPQNAYLMTLAMQGVIQSGTAVAAKALNRDDLAGKTGTTNSKHDAWFCGYNHSLVAVVWVGFDSLNRSLYEFGNQAALPIWMNFMNAALKKSPESEMAEPEGLVRVRVNPKTGLLASPDNANAIFEVFRKQHIPKRESSNAANSNNGSEVHETLEQQVY